MYSQQHPVTYYFYPLFDADDKNKHTQRIIKNTMLRSSLGVDELEGEKKRYNDFITMINTESTEVADSLLYIHIPYCNDLCKFCPFHVKVDKRDSSYVRYIDALCCELALLGQMARIQQKVFKAVYFGGGSPSIIPPRC